MVDKTEGTASPIEGPPSPITRTRRAPLTRTVEMQLHDPATGEVRVWHKEEVIKRRGRSPGETNQSEFAILYDEHLPRLFSLSGIELRTFLALIDDMGFNASFRYSTTELAMQVGGKPNSVSRALRALKTQGFVIEVGHREVYLDPRIVWRGDPIERRQVVDSLDKLGMLVKRIVPADVEEAQS